MNEELNLPCLYKVCLNTERNSYHFTTARKITYEVIFEISNQVLSGTALDGSDVYHIVVGKHSSTPEKGKRDSEISKTIDSIIAHFFSIKNRIVFYICDSDDGRQKARFRMFNGWYSKSSLIDGLEKIDYEIDAETMSYKISHIFHKQHVLGRDLIIESFDCAKKVICEAHKS